MIDKSTYSTSLQRLKGGKKRRHQIAPLSSGKSFCCSSERNFGDRPSLIVSLYTLSNTSRKKIHIQVMTQTLPTDGFILSGKCSHPHHKQTPSNSPLNWMHEQQRSNRLHTDYPFNYSFEISPATVTIPQFTFDSLVDSSATQLSLTKENVFAL